MDSKLKRGVDLQNRLWDTGFGKKFKDAFAEGGPMGKLTFLGILLVFCLNIFIVSFILEKDVTISFSSSAFLMSIANFLSGLKILSKSQFFFGLSMFSLSLAPISVYLFTRRVAQRKELVAFLATFLFVFPTPLSPNGNPLISALINGDGAHMVAFSFIPLLLLYAKGFLDKGIYAWALISIIVTSIVSVISPFALFNLLIFFAILTISEGFLRGFRITLARLFFMLIASAGLSYFWYYPNALTKILVLESVQAASSFFWKIFPILIPVVPIVGSLSFLIFDRREKLQPVFIAISLFVSYLVLYTVSAGFNSQGIFTAERYITELTFSQAFFLAIIFAFLFDLFYKKVMKHSLLKENVFYLVLILAVSVSAISFLLFVGINNLYSLRTDLVAKEAFSHYSPGVGSVSREGIFSDFVSVFSGLISIATLILLFSVFKYYPPKYIIKQIKEDKKVV